jgi:serine-type D-Ala-D-Ala carboxypeptidase/endopeptidase (penicillin-binding protein 4)
MKNLLKLLTLSLVLMFSINCSYAISTSKIDKLIHSSNLNETATVAVSIRNVETGNVVYEKNEKKLLHPASTLKIFTTYEALNVLGNDYFFKTQFYKDNNNNLYIKLGADPTLTRGQLKVAFDKLKETGNTKFNNIYFDDSIIDKKEFAPGWMWDDDTREETPKVSSYNLDGNVLKISAKEGNSSAEIKPAYKTAVVSNIKKGTKENRIFVDRYNWNNPELIEIYGEQVSTSPIIIPVSSMRRYYIENVERILSDGRFSVTNTKYASKLVPDNAKLLTEIVNPITPVIPKILQNSNNLMAETIFKIAGGKKYSSTGSNDLAIYAFYDFCKENNIKTDEIILQDGSGVSRNNLLSANWMSYALAKLYKQDNFNSFKDYMAQPGDGTLTERLFELRGSAWLKTGSLAHISSIAGYVSSNDGNTYAVSILIQNYNDKKSNVKDFEDKIINLIYTK